MSQMSYVSYVLCFWLYFSPCLSLLKVRWASLRYSDRFSATECCRFSTILRFLYLPRFPVGYLLTLCIFNWLFHLDISFDLFLSTRGLWVCTSHLIPISPQRTVLLLRRRSFIKAFYFKCVSIWRLMLGKGVTIWFTSGAGCTRY